MEITTKYLKNLLPETSYGKDSYAAFHQVLKGINSEAFRKWVSADLSRTLPLLAPKKLTLLHVCAMLGRDKHALVLLDLKKIDINAQDTSGWRVLHFAAFINDTALGNLFVKYGALYTPNIRGALPSKLQELAYPLEKKLSFFYESEGKIMSGDNEKFRQLTNKTLLDEIRILKEDLFEDWKNNEQQPGMHPDLIRKYQQFIKTDRPPVYIKFLGQDVGFEVFSHHLLPAGSIVYEYLGDFVSQLPVSNDTHRFENLDGKKACNEGPLTNDGVPNIVCMPIPNQEGANRLVFITLEDCPPNTPLRFDYGTDLIKKMKHQEVSQDHLTQAYKKIIDQYGTLKTALEKTRDYAPPLNSDFWQNCNVESKIRYLFTTPHAFVIIAITETIPIDDLCATMELFSKKTDPSEYAIFFKGILKDARPSTLPPPTKKKILEMASSVDAENLKNFFTQLFVRGSHTFPPIVNGDLP